METSAKPSSNHIGRKIGRIREMRGVKQDTLATELGISQQAISRIEQSETIEDEVLEKIAKILGVTTEAIKNFTEEAVVNYFNNTFHGSNHGPFYHCTFNPLDKLLELVEENKKLYERLVQAEKEKNDLLTGK